MKSEMTRTGTRGRLSIGHRLQRSCFLIDSISAHQIQTQVGDKHKPAVRTETRGMRVWAILSYRVRPMPFMLLLVGQLQ
ncbi:hypothetical protein D3C76_1475090 [compost metagenome]